MYLYLNWILVLEICNTFQIICFCLWEYLFLPEPCLIFFLTSHFSCCCVDSCLGTLSPQPQILLFLFYKRQYHPSIFGHSLNIFESFHKLLRILSINLQVALSHLQSFSPFYCFYSQPTRGALLAGLLFKGLHTQ